MRKSCVCVLAAALCLWMLPATALADRIGRQIDVIVPYNVVEEGGYGTQVTAVPKGSSCPVYRFFDTAAFNHFYTSDEQLKETLSQSYLNGTGTYRYEGIAWYWYNLTDKE